MPIYSSFLKYAQIGIKTMKEILAIEKNVMRDLFLMLFFAALFLLGCQNEALPTLAPILSVTTSTPSTDTDSANNTNSEKLPSTANQEFTATLTGTIESTLIGDGAFSCITALDAIVVGLYGVDPEGGYNTRIDLNLPIDLAPQTHTLTTREEGTNDGKAWAALNIDRDVYDAVAGGTIEVLALPSGAGQPVQASFDFTVAYGDETTISVAGKVDFIPSESTTVYCE